MTSTPWALITGASSGIGQTIAIRLARAGFRIVVNHFRDMTGATRTLELVKEVGSDGVAIDTDVGSGEEVTRMFEQFDDLGGALRVLVNNAGVQTWASLLDLAESDFDRTIRTNLKGTFLCMQQAGRRMRDGGGGSIINIGSGANHIPFPNLSDYCASKGGIEMLTKCAATEFGHFGVRVNCVAPGAIENERTKAENPDYAKTWANITPLRRCGTQDDVAEAVFYFATDASPFITGQTLYVDGGLWTRNQWPYE